MENHPIPQDITGFQFKLIGEMTVKQFAYLGAGIILGWVLFVLPLPGFIKIPLAIISVAFGAALAFVPISGRPLDTIIGNFLKAVFSPTQYVYQKQGGDILEKAPSPDLSKPSSQNQLKHLFGNKPKNKLDKKESVFFQNLGAYSANGPTTENLQPVGQEPHSQNGPAAPIQTPGAKLLRDEALQQENILKTAAVLEKELESAKQGEQTTSNVDQKTILESHQKTQELQDQLNDMLSQKQELEKRLVEMQKNMNKSDGPVFSTSLATEGPAKETKNVRSVPASMTKSAGMLAVSEFPNLLTGIIKDPRGNPLGNILVEVKDGEGNAVRAFKTNALGQFASATPLTNGKYTIDFEDPKSQNRFDTVGFEAKGEVILPIEVISIDNREELRRSLFN